MGLPSTPDARTEWADRVSRLVELIAMHIEAVERNTRAGSPRMIIEQYEELRDERLAELADLLNGTGLTVQFTPNERRAA